MYIYIYVHVHVCIYVNTHHPTMTRAVSKDIADLDDFTTVLRLTMTENVIASTRDVDILAWDITPI